MKWLSIYVGIIQLVYISKTIVLLFCSRTLTAAFILSRSHHLRSSSTSCSKCTRPPTLSITNTKTYPRPLNFPERCITDHLFFFFNNDYYFLYKATFGQLLWLFLWKKKIVVVMIWYYTIVHVSNMEKCPLEKRIGRQWNIWQESGLDEDVTYYQTQWSEGEAWAPASVCDPTPTPTTSTPTAAWRTEFTSNKSFQ